MSIEAYLKKLWGWQLNLMEYISKTEFIESQIELLILISNKIQLGHILHIFMNVLIIK